MKFQKKKPIIGIEDYSQLLPQYYGIPIPQTLKKYLNTASYSSLLDCGCGDGALLYVLKQNNYFKKRTVYAVDLSKNRINLVKKIDPKIQAYVDSAETLKNIKTASIDFFMSTHVIEHVDDKKMLKTIDRVMRKNGTIYIATVFKKWWGWYYYRKDGKWVMDITHLREYVNDRELINLIDRKKFEILETKKTKLSFPIIDFIVRRLFMRNLITNREFFAKNKLFNLLRKITILVPGYYNWEIILQKK